MHIKKNYTIDNNLRSKLISVTVSVVMLFYSFGYIFVYWNLHKTFKKEGIGKVRTLAKDLSVNNFNFNKDDIKNLPNSEFLLVIKIPKSIYINNDKNFQLVEKHEFRYHGEMYDIVKSKIINDTVYFLCISDKNEDKLEKAFLAHFFSDDSGKTNKKPIKSIIERLKYDATIDEKFEVPRIHNKSAKHFCLDAFPLETVMDIPLPPPKIV